MILPFHDQFVIKRMYEAIIKFVFVFISQILLTSLYIMQQRNNYCVVNNNSVYS